MTSIYSSSICRDRTIYDFQWFISLAFDHNIPTNSCSRADVSSQP